MRSTHTSVKLKLLPHGARGRIPHDRRAVGRPRQQRVLVLVPPQRKDGAPVPRQRTQQLAYHDDGAVSKRGMRATAMVHTRGTHPTTTRCVRRRRRRPWRAPSQTAVCTPTQYVRRNAGAVRRGAGRTLQSRLVTSLFPWLPTVANG
jgi:hypothetical protein